MESNKLKQRLIFHVDVNSAYLSWSAAHALQHGEKVDYRKIPSIVGGDPKSRHGIVLAKSIPAKKYGITTGEPLFSAMEKCPGVKVIPPCYEVYMRCSDALFQLLQKYTPLIQRYSVDECFMDVTGAIGDENQAIQMARDIKNRISKELGFTVNIGISSNKLLAKMASDLKKPDMVHVLFPDSVREKMWPLPVEDLFMVGRATKGKLHRLNIFTIGELANYDPSILEQHLKSHGIMLWNYANGIEDSEVAGSNQVNVKGMGNSTTISFDVMDRNTARLVMLSLCESVGMRLRQSRNMCKLVCVSVKSNDFISCSHQKKLLCATDSTKIICNAAFELFDDLWKGEPIRQLGVHVSDLCSNELYQISLFQQGDFEKQRAIDKTMDGIRRKFGNDSVIRSAFLGSGLKPVTGGIVEEYPVMSSML